MGDKEKERQLLEANFILIAQERATPGWGLGIVAIISSIIVMAIVTYLYPEIFFPGHNCPPPSFCSPARLEQMASERNFTIFGLGIIMGLLLWGILALIIRPSLNKLLAEIDNPKWAGDLAAAKKRTEIQLAEEASADEARKLLK